MLRACSFLRVSPMAPRPVMLRSITEFYDTVTPGNERPKAGRAWTASELRMKSFGDLHKLWHVLLKEKNMLMTQRAEYRSTKDPTAWTNRYRMKKVRLSMARIRVVLGERQRVYLEAKQKVRGMYAQQKRLERLQKQEEQIKIDLAKVAATQSQSE
eukprot:TRINITY_DN16754_c0_g1_i1.p1 TRINITY_DN16754_c0_g1~~TRINITY_DN16754_c0_g1_i1.p1  ORF type:complete len:156 (-),score=38.74 TRINITY_DN16754_c0_g1_i1:13-480(-)